MHFICMAISFIMTKVYHYTPELSSKFYCPKGGLHAEEPLNMVCLDPLCRNNPLACSVCFSHTHKYHRVLGVDQFIDEYSRNVKNLNQSKTKTKIQKHHSRVKELINTLRQDITRQLDSFELSIDEYADQLNMKTNLRDQISQTLRIPLEPSKLRESRSEEEFKDTLIFILNNSLFDSSSRMVRVADVLKQDEERIHALLDKMVNMTEHCQQYIRDVIKSLNFSDQTIGEQKISFKAELDKMKVDQNQFDSDNFKIKENMHTTLTQGLELRKPHWRQTFNKIKDVKPPTLVEDLKFTFSFKYKHQKIQVKNQFSVGVSNITALKPQYALLTPHLTTEPTSAKEWTLKINNCRNFASENTMGIGLVSLSTLQNCKFQGYYPAKATILTSQGYVMENGSSRKTNLIFGTGDLLYCRYDPYYKLFEISKENGRKVSLTVEPPDSEELFICVRLTYASDQIQIL